MKVFDTSALLALFLDEPGAEFVLAELESGASVCSAANWAELAQKAESRGLSWTSVRSLMMSWGTAVEPATMSDAEAAAALWRPRENLSLADRFCLALGARMGATVLTADKAWAGRPGVEVIR